MVHGGRIFHDVRIERNKGGEGWGGGKGGHETKGEGGLRFT